MNVNRDGRVSILELREAVRILLFFVDMIWEDLLVIWFICQEVVIISGCTSGCSLANKEIVYGTQHVY